MNCAVGAREAFRIVSEITRSDSIRENPQIRGRDGVKITTEEGERNRWADYFEQAMNKVYVGNNLIPIPEAAEDVDVSMLTFTEDEVKETLKKLKRSKAPWYDGITWEMVLAE